MSKSSDVRIALVACGLTEWDADDRVCGSADVPLCAEGLAEADRIARLLADEAVALVLHGPDEASEATAKAVARRQDARKRKVEGLTEMGLGLWEGLKRSEFEERYPTASKGWREDPASVSAPEGETLAEADERIVGELARTLERSKAGDAAIAVILRPIAFGLAVCWLKGLPMGSWREAGSDAGPVLWHTAARSDLKGVRTRARTSE